MRSDAIAAARMAAAAAAADVGDFMPNYEASISKVFGTELQRQMGIMGIRIAGMAGQVEPGSPYAPLRGRLERWALAAPSYTIAGGTSEVNRNIIATRRLGLPRA